MPRTILTDDVIERLCPEYQPLGLPNAYFKNVGGNLKSGGIKATPSRAPPKPSRIQYLAQNSNMSLVELERQVSTNSQKPIVQPVMLLDFTPIQPQGTLENDYFIDEFNRIASGEGDDFIEEAIAFYDNFGERVPNLITPLETANLEEKNDMPYVDIVAVQTQGDQGDIGAQIKSGEEEIKRGAEEIKRIQEAITGTEERLSLVGQMREQSEKSTTQVAEQIAQLKQLREELSAPDFDKRNLPEKFKALRGLQEGTRISRAERQAEQSVLPDKFKALRGLQEGTRISRQEREATAILPRPKLTRAQSDERVEAARKQLLVAVSGLQQEPRSLSFQGKEPRKTETLVMPAELRTRFDLAKAEASLGGKLPVEGLREAAREKIRLRGAKRAQQIREGLYNPFTTELR